MNMPRHISRKANHVAMAGVSVRDSCQTVMELRARAVGVWQKAHVLQHERE